MRERLKAMVARLKNNTMLRLNPSNATDESALALVLVTIADALEFELTIYFIPCLAVFLGLLATLFYRVPKDSQTKLSEWGACGLGSATAACVIVYIIT